MPTEFIRTNKCVCVELKASSIFVYVETEIQRLLKLPVIKKINTNNIDENKGNFFLIQDHI